MEFNEEFKEELVRRINESCNFDNLDYLEKLLSVYNSITNIETQKAQLEMLRESQALMKDVDVNDILNTFLRK